MTSLGFSTNWEKLLAYHHGLYLPQVHHETKSVDEIRSNVGEFSEKVHIDDPNDACKYLKIEEFRCLQSQQYQTEPQNAAKSCVKWFTEWSQCMWDQEKIIKGYNYLEPRVPRKHRPYIGAPDFQYS